MEYNYDVVRDWAPPSKLLITCMCILAVAVIIVGVINARMTYDVGIKVISTFFMIGPGVLTLYVYAIRKGRPLIKSGIFNVIIHKDLLEWNMKFFFEAKQIKLSEIRRIQLSRNKIEFSLFNGLSQTFKINQIRNSSKRDEFVQIMRNLQIEIDSNNC